MASLLDHLRRRIAVHGPLTVADYMADCLGHPEHGYYATGDPFGAGGDFTTAPEISQMFGELIGLWCAETWTAIGAPEPVLLAELGPGRGTLMADALRAARVVPAFAAALEVHLVETSPLLRRRQRETLGHRPATWHDDVTTIPPAPSLVVANEFFDALPVRQFERTADGWCERLVDADADGLRFVLAPPAPAPLVPAALAEAAPGAVVEVSPAAIAIADALARRLVGAGGGALIIDYGHGASAVGETLQAVRRHAYAAVLEAPGEADLTAHVDFAAVARAAAEAGAVVHGPVPQAAFLAGLGIEARAAALAAGATPAQVADIEAALKRLTDVDAMGTLFKAMALTAPGTPSPPGFR
jgi:NADH dehydrogenase [ubiquinone] 1 alpha subcomplex assembly factor 7